MAQTVTDFNVQTSGKDPGALRKFYDRNLILNALPNLVHDQFGQKRNIPANGGKTINFRRLAPLPKAMAPLTEGVTPRGNDLTWSTIESTLQQYGDYITISDVLQTTGIDSNLIEAGEILARQAGETLDAITREVLSSGTNVQYANGQLARYLLSGGKSSGNDYLTVDTIKQAVRTLKRNNAKRINNYYVAIVHPDVAYDLMDDPKWENVKTYSDPEDMYNGEIGRLYGVRFVETSEAKIFKAEDLSAAARNLTVASTSGKTITVSETLSAEDAAALAERKIIVKGMLYTISSVSGSVLTVEETLATGSAAPAAGDVVYPGEAGSEGRDVYSTLILGADAYGTTELDGGGMRNIVKQLGSGGTADPLDQRATTGWKALKTAEILVQEYMVRIETVASYA